MIPFFYRDTVELLSSVLQVSYTLGLCDDGIKVVDVLRRQCDNTAPLTQSQAMMYIRAKRLGEARQLLEPAVEEYPDDAGIRALYAVVLREVGDLSWELELDRAERMNPTPETRELINMFSKFLKRTPFRHEAQDLDIVPIGIAC